MARVVQIWVKITQGWRGILISGLKALKENPVQIFLLAI